MAKKGKKKEQEAPNRDTDASLYNDPAVDRFQSAMKHLAASQWKKAQEELGEIAETSDIPEVAERARLMLRVCLAKLAKAPEQPEDPFLAAVFEKNRGNFAAALELCTKAGKPEKDERCAYLTASIHALAGRPDEAVAALQVAVQLNPKNRIYAFHDPDFESLLDRPELEQLFEAS
ncbi:MAG: hypothetical protein KDD47_02165 [Acidobacteria bacterium]|nr:hypothetical protein [Acidobacteriota bacterium]